MSDISKLFFRRFISRLTPGEEEEIRRWESLGDNYRELSRRLADPKTLGEEYRLRSLIDTDRAEAEMMRRIRDSRRPARRRHIITVSVTIAAAAVLLGLFLLRPVQRMSVPVPSAKPVMAEKTIEDFRPGQSRALLSDGWSSHRARKRRV